MTLFIKSRLIFSCISLLSLLLAASGIAQPNLQQSKILEVADQLDKEWQLNQQKANAFALKNGIPLRQEFEDGRVIQLVNVVDGIPEYYTTHNYGAAQTTRVVELWPDGESGLELTGDGYDALGEWDAGHVRKSHVEFTNEGESRVTNMDGESPTHFHATHVAGTLIAGGVNSNAKGMAYKGNLKAWDWSGDGGEMANAAANGLEISNHSYGQVRGWDWNNGNWVWYGNENVDDSEDFRFGFYDGGARSFDLIAYNAPNYLIVKSAGNDRGEGPGNAGQNGNPEKDGGTDGYDCIGGSGVAKNILTVGAVYQVSEYNGPESVVMSSFSGWGPADDGRIKPDIVGKGVSVFSTMDGHNNDYASLSGTSMSTPNVAGSLALLQKHYQDTHDDQAMLSSTLKGLVIHTADEAGPHLGPDYKFGWGLMNTQKAAELISENVEQEIIEEIILEGGNIHLKQIDVSEGAELRITLCWTDPPAVPLPFELNPRDPMLVNDMDIVLMDESFNEFFPYSLDPLNPGNQATTDGKNAADNVEMIYLSNASAGTYTIMVTHDGWLEGGEQEFSLITTGVLDEDALPECADALLNPEDGADDILLNEYLTWTPAANASSYDIYFGTDGEGIEQPTNIFNGENIADNGFSYLMDPSETYFLQVIPRNDLGAAEGCEQIWSFSTMDAIAEYPYSQPMNVISMPDLPPFWQAYNFTEAAWHSTNEEYHSSDVSVVCALPDVTDAAEFDNWFVSPPFLVEEGMEYKVDFYFKNAVEGNSENLQLFIGQSPFIDDFTSMVYDGQVNNAATWKSGSALIEPGYDGIMFLGFYTTNPEGYGLYLDDVTIDHWGIVGQHTFQDNSQITVWYSDNQIIVKSALDTGPGKVAVHNQTGRMVYQSDFYGRKLITTNQFEKGVYIVRVQIGDIITTNKIMIY